MDNVKYRVVFKGEISTGSNIEEVKEKLAAAFKADSAKIEQLFSGKKIAIKKNASYEECEKLYHMLANAGAVADIEEENKPASEPQGPPPLPSREERRRSMAPKSPVKNADEKFCSNCGAAIKIKALACPRCGMKQKQSGSGCFPAAAIAVGVCLFGVFIIGILAAIAIPQFHAYRTRAYQESLKAELRQVYLAEDEYFNKYNRFTDNMDELNYTPNPNVSIEIVGLEDECFSVKGESIKLTKRYYIDCYGEITEEEVRD